MAGVPKQQPEGKRGKDQLKFTVDFYRCTYIVVHEPVKPVHFCHLEGELCFHCLFIGRLRCPMITLFLVGLEGFHLDW